MSSLLKADIDLIEFERKLKKTAKVYGESQEQAIKRWGVQSCRDLAKYSQVFGSKPKIHKMAMMKDAAKVLFTHRGSAKASRTGKSMIFTRNGKKAGVAVGRYLKSEDEVIRWINNHRRGANNRTVELPPGQKSVCSEALFKRAINKKYKATAGMAKDGWLDAGEKISKGQRGKSPARIGKSLMKFARKPAKLGTAKTGSRAFRAFGLVTNKLPYVRSKYVLSNSNKRKAVVDGARNTLKWYKRVIRAENRKKK